MQLPPTQQPPLLQVFAAQQSWPGPPQWSSRRPCRRPRRRAAAPAHAGEAARARDAAAPPRPLMPPAPPRPLMPLMPPVEVGRRRHRRRGAAVDVAPLRRRSTWCRRSRSCRLSRSCHRYRWFRHRPFRRAALPAMPLLRWWMCCSCRSRRSCCRWCARFRCWSCCCCMPHNPGARLQIQCDAALYDSCVIHGRVLKTPGQPHRSVNAVEAPSSSQRPFVTADRRCAAAPAPPSARR